MTSTIERKLISEKERVFPKELTTLNGSKGVGLIIIDNSGKIFVGEETSPKDIKENSVRTIGQLSIPSESRKPKETPLKNIQAGVLEEVIGDKDISLNAVGLYILKTPSVPTFYESIVDVEGDPTVKGDLSILFYDPEKGTDPLRTGSGELANSRWQDVSTVLKDPNVRPLTVAFLQSIIGKNNPEVVITKYQRIYKANSQNRISLFPDGFPKESFLTQRSGVDDIHS